MTHIIVGLMVIIILLIALNAFLIDVHRKERDQLLNRIMAKDFPEYATFLGKKAIGKSGNFIKQLLDKQNSGLV